MANPNVDGSVAIGVDLDDKEAMKELNRLKREIKSLEKSIEDMRIKRSPLAEEMNEYAVQLDKAKAKLAELKYLQKQDEAVLSGGGIGQYDEYMRAYERQGEIAADIDRQEAEVKRLEKAWKDVSEKVREYDTRIGYAEEKLEKSKIAAGEMAKRVSTSEKAGRKMAEAQKKVNERLSGTSKGLGNIMKRLKGIAMSAVLFSVAYRALNSLTQYLGNMITANEEFADSLAAIKGNLLTAFQPIYEAVAPALGTLLDLVNSVTRGIAQFVSIIFGKSVKSSAEAAKNQYEMAGAIESTGDAAEKAQKQLLSFDELNILQDTSVDTGGVSDAADEIKASFELIGDAENESWVDKLTNSNFGKGFVQFWETLKDTLTPAFSAVWDGVTWALEGIINTILNADPDVIEAVLMGIVTALGIWLGYKGVTSVIDKTKSAIEGFSSALQTHPVLAAAGIIGGITSAVLAFAEFKFNSSETGKLTNAIKDIGDKASDATDEVNNLLETCKMKSEDVDADYAGITDIADKYYDLSQKATFTDEEKTLIEEYKAQLDEYAPGMITNIDEVTGAWRGTRNELQAIIDKQYESYMVAAYDEIISDLYKSKASNEATLREAEKELEKAEAEFQALSQQRKDELWDEIKSNPFFFGEPETREEFDEWVETYYKYVRSMNEPQRALEEARKEIEQLRAAMEDVDADISYYQNRLKGIPTDRPTSAQTEAEISKNAESVGREIGETLANALYEGLRNNLNSAIPSRNFKIPIPALATGSVIPPNRQFLAVLGDNKQEPEVVAPLSTIRQAVTEALSARGYGGSTPFYVILEMNGKEMARTLVPDINAENNRIGLSLTKK